MGISVRNPTPHLNPLCIYSELLRKVPPTAVYGRKGRGN